MGAEGPNLDFPSFPVRRIYFPVTAKYFPVPAQREFTCKPLPKLIFLHRVWPFRGAKDEIPGYLPGSREFAGATAGWFGFRPRSILAADRGMPGAIDD
jgi:hypothetical protein